MVLDSSPSLSAKIKKAASTALPDRVESGFISIKNGVQIYYKDWSPKGAQPTLFNHGWPLSADDWDAQMMFFLLKGYRVIAHDRRGHGRSTQTHSGNEMDTYAADVAALMRAKSTAKHVFGIIEQITFPLGLLKTWDEGATFR